MRTEEQTPIEQRFLWIEGKVSPSSVEAIKSGLPTEKPANTEILFIGYAYADLPMGKSFHVIYPRSNPDAGILCESRIIAVTQQWGKPEIGIPHGWKTICFVEFPQGVPDIIETLPTIDAWGEGKDYICLCDEDTWKAIKKLKPGRI